MLQHADMCQSLTVPEVRLFILLPKLFVQILEVDFFFFEEGETRKALSIQR